MTDRKKWLVYEILSWIVLLVIIILLPSMPWWKYLSLGLLIGLYAIFAKRQGRIEDD